MTVSKRESGVGLLLSLSVGSGIQTYLFLLRMRGG